MTDQETSFIESIRTLDPELRYVVAAVVEAPQRDHSGELMARVTDLPRGRFNSRDEWLRAIVDVIGQ